MDDNVGDTILQSLKIINDFKTSTKDFFKSCYKFTAFKDEINDNIMTLQSHLKYILSSYSTLEKNFQKLGDVNFNLHNIGYLSQEPFTDKLSLYKSALKTYKWTNLLIENAALASSLLTQNSLKRSTNNPFSRKHRQISIHNISPQMIEAIINSMNRLFADMTVSLTSFPSKSLNLDEPIRKFPLQPTNTVILNIKLGTTLRAKVCLRSLIIEAVSIQGYDEIYSVSSSNLSMNYDDIANAALLLFNENSSFNLGSSMWTWTNISPDLPKNDDKDKDVHEIWIESKHQVFRKITEYAQAAMLHFYSPLIPELAIKSFMTWLHSYSNLFTAICHRCQKQLKDFMPPTWRDFRTLEPYHEFCRF